MADRLALTYEGRRVPVTSAPFRVGRGTACDLVVDDPSTSRHHLTITDEDGRWVVTDTSSTGTWAGSRRLTAPLVVTGPVELRLGSPDGPAVQVGLLASPPDGPPPPPAPTPVVVDAPAGADAVDDDTRRSRRRRRRTIATITVVLAVAAGVVAVDGELPTGDPADVFADTLLTEGAGYIEIRSAHAPEVSQSDDTVLATTDGREVVELDDVALVDVGAWLDEQSLLLDPVPVAGEDVTFELLDTAPRTGFATIAMASPDGRFGAVLIGESAVGQVVQEEEGWSLSIIEVDDDGLGRTRVIRPAWPDDQLVAASDTIVPADGPQAEVLRITSHEAEPPWYCGGGTLTGSGEDALDASLVYYEYLASQLVQMIDSYAQVYEDMVKLLDISGNATAMVKNLFDIFTLGGDTIADTSAEFLLKAMADGTGRLVGEFIPGVSKLLSGLVGVAGTTLERLLWPTIGPLQTEAAYRVRFVGVVLTYITVAIDTATVAVQLTAGLIMSPLRQRMFAMSERAAALRSALPQRVRAPNGFTSVRADMAVLHYTALSATFAAVGFVDRHLGLATVDYTRCNNVPGILPEGVLSVSHSGGNRPFRLPDPQQLTVESGCPDAPCRISLGDVGSIDYEPGAALPSFAPGLRAPCVADSTGEVASADFYEINEVWRPEHRSPTTTNTEVGFVPWIRPIPISTPVPVTYPVRTDITLVVQYELEPTGGSTVVIPGDPPREVDCLPTRSTSEFTLTPTG